MKFKGQIEGFPQPIVELMLYYQGEQGNKVDVSVFEGNRECPKTNGGFDWEKTNEGAEFWGRVIHEKDFIPFYDLYPKEEQRGIRLDFKPKGSFDAVVESEGKKKVVRLDFHPNSTEAHDRFEATKNYFDIEITNATDADWYFPLVGEKLVAFNNFGAGGLLTIADITPNIMVFNKHCDLITPCKTEEWTIDRGDCKDVYLEDKEGIPFKIKSTLDSLASLLLEKNKRYGNAALEPLGVFNKHSSGNGILIRLDDKLRRIANSEELRKNDIADIMGYLTLLCVDKGWNDFNDLID